MYSVWRTSIDRKRDARSPCGRRGVSRLTMPAQSFHHLPPIYSDSTFINDTIRREHSPPLARDE